MNHGGNSITMDDLDDNMLTQILLRLPNCATILACSLVNKRWCSLIFDSKFPVQFINYKKKTTALLMGSGSDTDELPWTILKTAEQPLSLDACNAIRNLGFINEITIGSPKLSLEYLPRKFYTPRATFKDLVLCSDYYLGSRVYYITNPLTKQWVALPRSPRLKDPWTLVKSPALVCQPLYNHTRDYKFRVMEVRQKLMVQSIDTIELIVYCSEIGEWKEINLRVPKEVGPLKVSTDEPETVVCNGIVYFKSGLCLVAFDPFDVNVACDTTLEARVMPPLPNFGYLQESSGQLLVVHSPNCQGVPCLWYQRDGTVVKLHMVVWKLDLNQAPLVWETTFKGLCKGAGRKYVFPPSPELRINISTKDIGVHPYNDKLIYMYLPVERLCVLCNTRTGCIKTLKSLANYNNVEGIQSFHKFQYQWWPTLVPACATASH